MPPCPRCARENPASAVSCAACGTPLALGEEPSPRTLDRELDLDRRGRGRDAEDPPGLDAPREAAADVAPEGDRPRAAPPARRLASWAVDGALVAALGLVAPAMLLGTPGPPAAGGPGRFAFGVGFGILLGVEGFVAVVAFVYVTVAHALAGATLGKRLARIRVVGPDGRPPGIARAARRSAWAVASVASLGLGLLPAIFGPSGRALHDLLAGTRVVEAP